MCAVCENVDIVDKIGKEKLNNLKRETKMDFCQCWTNFDKQVMAGLLTKFNPISYLPN